MFVPSKSLFSWLIKGRKASWNKIGPTDSMLSNERLSVWGKKDLEFALISQKKPDIPPAGDKIIQVQMLLMAVAVFSSWFEQGLIACCFFSVAKKKFKVVLFIERIYWRFNLISSHLLLQDGKGTNLFFSETHSLGFFSQSMSYQHFFFWAICDVNTMWILPKANIIPPTNIAELRWWCYSTLDPRLPASEPEPYNM